MTIVRILGGVAILSIAAVAGLLAIGRSVPSELISVGIGTTVGALAGIAQNNRAHDEKGGAQ